MVVRSSSSSSNYDTDRKCSETRCSDFKIAGSSSADYERERSKVDSKLFAVTNSSSKTRLEILGECTKRIEVLLSLREFHFEVLRDPLTQIYYFRAIEVGSVDRDDKKKICHSNKALDAEIFSVRHTPNHKNGVRYERSMSEPQVNSLLLPNERWKISMVPAATALLKRAILIPTPNGSDTSKTHRLCDRLLLTFDGAYDVPEKVYTYLKCMRNVAGRLFVVNVEAESDNNVANFIGKDINKNISCFDGYERPIRDCKNHGGTVYDEPEVLATQPAGEVPVVLRFCLYDPRRYLYLEAAAPILLSNTLQGRRRQIFSAMDRLDVVSTSQGDYIATLRITSARLPKWVFCERNGKQDGCIGFFSSTAEQEATLLEEKESNQRGNELNRETMCKKNEFPPEGNSTFESTAYIEKNEYTPTMRQINSSSCLWLSESSSISEYQLMQMNQKVSSDECTKKKMAEKDEGINNEGVSTFPVDLLVGFTSTECGPQSRGKPVILVCASPIYPSICPTSPATSARSLQENGFTDDDESHQVRGSVVEGEYGQQNQRVRHGCARYRKEGKRNDEIEQWNSFISDSTICTRLQSNMPSSLESLPVSSTIFLPMIPKMPPVGTKFPQNISYLSIGSPKVCCFANDSGKKGEGSFSCEELNDLLQRLSINVDERKLVPRGLLSIESEKTLSVLAALDCGWVKCNKTYCDTTQMHDVLKDNISPTAGTNNNKYVVISKWQLLHPLANLEVRASDVSQHVIATRYSDMVSKTINAALKDAEVTEVEIMLHNDSDTVKITPAGSQRATDHGSKKTDGLDKCNANSHVAQDSRFAEGSRNEVTRLCCDDNVVIFAPQSSLNSINDNKRWYDGVSTLKTPKGEHAKRDQLWETRRDAAFQRSRELRIPPKFGPPSDEIELKRQADRDIEDLKERRLLEERLAIEKNKKVLKETKKRQRQEQRDKKKTGKINDTDLRQFDTHQKNMNSSSDKHLTSNPCDLQEVTMERIEKSRSVINRQQSFNSTTKGAFVPETGSPKWAYEDGILVFRRAQILGGKHMIVSVLVLRCAVNGSVRLIAYDPESCREFVSTIDHYDTSMLLAAYVRAILRVGKKEGGAGQLRDSENSCQNMPDNHARYSPADIKRGYQHLVYLCNRLKMEEEIGSQILTIFPSEKNEVCTKDIRQLLQVVRNDLESLLHSYGLREGSLTSILPTDVANTLYSTNHFINDVMIALNKHTSDQVSFEEFLAMLGQGP